MHKVFVPPGMFQWEVIVNKYVSILTYIAEWNEEYNLIETACKGMACDWDLNDFRNQPHENLEEKHFRQIGIATAKTLETKMSLAYESWKSGSDHGEVYWRCDQKRSREPGYAGIVVRSLDFIPVAVGSHWRFMY